MAEVDTSSYPKAAALPVQKSPLEQMQQYGSIQQQQQQIQSNAISIDKQKLDLMNTQFGLINSELSNLAATPNITKDQAKQRLTTFATTYKLPPEAVNHMMSELDQAPTVKDFAEFALRRGMDVQQKINNTYGQTASVDTGQVIQPGVEKSPMMGGGFSPAGLPVQKQLPPTTPTVGPNNQPGYLGPQSAPLNATPLPVARPIAANGTGGVGPTTVREMTPSEQVASRFPNFVPSGPAPGVAGAQAAVGEQSGKDYAIDLARAKNFQADLYPMNRVLEILKAQGPQAFGQGTDALNTVKNAIATWLPNVDPKTVESVSDFEQAKKYLVQAARVNGNTATNDQLAASFEGNPDTKMTGATIENVIKSNIALRRMQQAQTLLFGQQNLPPDQYSKWISKNQNVLDPRAFGFDIMDGDARLKLLKSMATQDNAGNWIAKKGKEKEFKRFDDSLSFAHNADLISPSNQ